MGGVEFPRCRNTVFLPSIPHLEVVVLSVLSLHDWQIVIFKDVMFGKGSPHVSHATHLDIDLALFRGGAGVPTPPRSAKVRTAGNILSAMPFKYITKPVR